LTKKIPEHRGSCPSPKYEEEPGISGGWVAICTHTRKSEVHQQLAGTGMSKKEASRDLDRCYQALLEAQRERGGV
jgi:hypothetical protein